MDKPWKAIHPPMYKWYKLREQIEIDYPRLMIFREHTKLKLGFTTCEEHHWDRMTKKFEHRMNLDFFSELKRTMFLLKYGAFLEK